MRQIFAIWVWLGLCVPPGFGAADAVEELPPPKQEQSVVTSVGQPAVDSAEIVWGLIGPRGRHYFAGSSGLVDYVRAGQRQVVKIESEDASKHATPDDEFLYYRETGAGHRWAVSRHANGDRRYRIYFQDAEATGAWQLFQRAQATWEQSSLEAAPLWILPEATCGLPSPSEMEVFAP